MKISLLRTLCPPIAAALVTALAIPAVAQTPAPAPADTDYKSEYPIVEPHAMVVSVHHLATDAGVAILRKGGNSIDAA
ncbi:MAG: hypothetical protein ACLGXA_18035, partial [Acidobacteriota bacterium]